MGFLSSDHISPYVRPECTLDHGYSVHEHKNTLHTGYVLEATEENRAFT